MKQVVKKISLVALSLLMVMSLILMPSLNTSAATNKSIKTCLSNVAQKTIDRDSTDSTSQDPWLVLAVNRSGMSPKGLKKWNNSYKASLDFSTFQYPSEYAKAILALTSMGENCSNYKGINLIAKMLEDKDTVFNCGESYLPYVLLALDCNNYSIPSTCSITREEIVAQLMNVTITSEGLLDPWGYGGDIDTTYMVAQALAPYVDSNANVKNFVSKLTTISYVQGYQDSTGGIVSYGSVNSCSTAQVAIALCCTDNDVASYTVNGKSMVDCLLSYADSSSGLFDKDNYYGCQLPTEQCFLALVACYRNSMSDHNLFDMTKVKVAKTSVKKVTKGKKSISVKVKSLKKKVSGYQVRISTKKSMKKASIKTYKAGSTVKKLTNLKRKKTYYIQVRSYKKGVSGRYYSAWSSKVKVKTK